MINKQLPDHIFRGYDLRGIVGEDLDDKRVRILGKAYATWLLRRRIYDCVLGYDCRLSSLEFRDAMIDSLVDSGITVYDIGHTISQISYFAQYYFRTRGLVMITASHNPKEYNGFKFGTGFSETMVSEEIQELKKIAQSEKFASRNVKGKVLKEDVLDHYIKDIIKRTDNIKKMKIVVDASCGSAGPIMPKFLRTLGCEVIEQNTVPDGNFPTGTPDPTEKAVQQRLADRVMAENADLGFSFDCDGDRLGVVDHEGNLIWNDVLVSIYAKDILSFLPGSKVIYNVLCSKQVEEVITVNGGRPIMWMVGHSFLKAKAKSEGAIFAGELSGHFFFLDNFYGHDDTAIGCSRILSYLTRENKTLKEIVSKLPKYISSPEIKVGCPDSIKFSLVKEKIGAEVKEKYPQAKFSEIDGIRMDTEREMLVIRASQNGPYVTIKMEAKEKDKYEELKNVVNKILHKYKEIDFSHGVNTDALN